MSLMFIFCCFVGWKIDGSQIETVLGDDYTPMSEMKVEQMLDLMPFHKKFCIML